MSAREAVFFFFGRRHSAAGGGAGVQRGRRGWARRAAVELVRLQRGGRVSAAGWDLGGRRSGGWTAEFRIRRRGDRAGGNSAGRGLGDSRRGAAGCAVGGAGLGGARLAECALAVGGGVGKSCPAPLFADGCTRGMAQGVSLSGRFPSSGKKKAPPPLRLGRQAGA